MSSSHIFYHDIEGTMHRYRTTTAPQCDPDQSFYLLAGSVNSCNIGEHDYKLGWGFELWHIYRINTFTWHLGYTAEALVA